MARTIKTKESCLGSAAPKTKQAAVIARRALARTRLRGDAAAPKEKEESAEASAAEQTTEGAADATARALVLGRRAAMDTAKKGVQAARTANAAPSSSARDAVPKASARHHAKARRRAPRNQAHYAGDAIKKRAVRIGRLRASVKAASMKSAAAPRAKGAASAARSAKNGILAFARMAARAARSAQMALGAVGTVAAAVIVIICMVGLVAASAFGIFFMGGDMGDGNPTLREVVAQIDAEHSPRIEELKAQNPADEVALSGSKASWGDVLAVFAVRCAHDPHAPLDVITLDDARQTLLREVFWGMNSIESAVEQREVTEIVLTYAEDGTPMESQETVTRSTLRITLVRKTADEAADLWRFTAEQREILSELCTPENAKLWQMVLHGAVGSGDIVEVALSQVGNVGGAPYWSWYGFSSRVEWCACFVSWCANECGYIEAGAVPKFSYCPSGVQWFRDAGLWLPGGSEPAPGDIVFFDWDNDGTSDHVGIVESCDGSTVRTVEGNSSDSCRRRSYSVASSSILGYGTPMY